MTQTGKRRLPRNVALLQIHSVFANCIFFIGVILPYIKDEIGLGFAELMVAQALFAAVILLMEVPTGWLSDIWGRKKTMILSGIMSFAGFCLWSMADSFADILIAEACLATGISLMSGSNSALLYDTLLESGQENEYRRLEGKRHGFSLYAVAVACAAGGFLYSIDHHLPVMMAAFMSFLALVVILFLREPLRHKEPAHKHPLADMAETMRYALHGHREVAGIILAASILFASTKTLLWTQQPYYSILNLPVESYGLLMACGFLAGGISGHLGHRLDGKMGSFTVIFGCLSLLAAACLIAGLWPGYHGVPLLLTGSVVFGFGYPRVQDAINRLVPSARRATILSTASLAVNIVSIPLMAAVGRVADDRGIAAALLMIAVLMVTAGIFSALLIRRRAAGAADAA